MLKPQYQIHSPPALTLRNWASYFKRFYIISRIKIRYFPKLLVFVVKTRCLFCSIWSPVLNVLYLYTFQVLNIYIKHFPVRSKYISHHPLFKIPSFCREVKGNVHFSQLLPTFDDNAIRIFELIPPYFLLPEATWPNAVNTVITGRAALFVCKLN